MPVLQVLNRHTAFHARMVSGGDAGRIAYDIALRLTSGYQPGPFDDGRLNASAYTRVALSAFGARAGPGSGRYPPLPSPAKRRS